MTKICHYYDKSKSWYYDTLASQERVREYEQMILSEASKIRKINPAYGTRKLWHQLARNGVDIGRDKLHRILNKHDQTLPRRYKKVRTTFPGMYDYGFQNLLADLKVDHKNQVWCTDITYIATTEGILYVSAMMD